MNITRIMAIIIIVMALIIAVVPQFTHCVHEKAPCVKTAKAEIAVGVPLLAIGALLFSARRKETVRYLSIPGIVLGIFAILLPTTLTGVCMNPTMICVTAMRPAMIAAGVIVLIANGLVLAFGKGED